VNVRSASGRAGRLRLMRQLATADRASELLDRKQRILAGELQRLELMAGRTAEDWQRSARQAATWLSRSAALDGQRGLAAATPGARANVQIQLGRTMGVRYPVHAAVTYPEEAVRAGSSALVFATATHRQALDAAARHAAASRAVASLREELQRTRARQRAIDNRLVPRLTEALRSLEARLDEFDREENLRLHWAIRRPAGGERS
jgi:V/A-type H+/Na+-transporting ATPase subunit D